MLVEARLLVLVMVVASLMLGACGAPETPIDPAEAVEGCFWVGPYTLEREQTNTAFPDSGATYWSARFTVPNGARLRLRGRYPHARYMSFVSYNSLKSPTDSIYDTQISPETDHLNPFRLGARRDVESRAYGLDVLPQSPPDGERAENTIYADPRFDGQVSLFYRVYVPDQGFDATGGTGLPDVELVQADGSVLHGQPACDALQVDRHLLVSSSGRRWVYTMAREQPWRAETFPAQSRPEWRREGALLPPAFVHIAQKTIPHNRAGDRHCLRRFFAPQRHTPRYRGLQYRQKPSPLDAHSQNGSWEVPP